MTSARCASLGLFTALLLLAQPALALDLGWPEGSDRVIARSEEGASFALAEGVFAEGAVPLRSVDGPLLEEVWQVPGALGGTARLFALLRDQLIDQGYDITFTCADSTCGGFDFRHALPIAGGPEMFVDLGDFRYLAATRVTDTGPEHVALTVSHGGEFGYAHLALVGPPGAPPTVTVPSPRVDGTGLTAGLMSEGHVVLEDLSFATGASALSDRRYDSLTTLADWLAGDTARRIVLVGHTDVEGALDANIDLSRARAEAVRDALVDTFGADPAQIEAEGIGYLSPRAANTSAEGREANRRVEVVLLPN